MFRSGSSNTKRTATTIGTWMTRNGLPLQLPNGKEVPDRELVTRVGHQIEVYTKKFSQKDCFGGDGVRIFVRWMTVRLNHYHILRSDAPLGRFEEVVSAGIFEFASSMPWCDFAKINHILLPNEPNSPCKTFPKTSKANPPSQETGLAHI